MDDAIDAKRWLPIRQAAAYCGLSKDTLRRLYRRGQLHLYQLANSRRPVLVDRIELDELIEKSALPQPRGGDAGAKEN